MALLILGQSECPICGAVITDEQKVIMFPPFVGNELDPLIVFNDAACHEECVVQHPLAGEVASVLKVMDEKLGRGCGYRRCDVCAKQVEDPDEYMVFGYLTSDESSPLFKYNFAQFHRGCLPRWPHRAHVRRLLEDLRDSGRWKGAGLSWILDWL